MLPKRFARARRLSLVLFSALALGAMGPPDCVDPPGPPGPPDGQGPRGKDWRFYGGNRANTHYATGESQISTGNVDQLQVKWAYQTTPDVPVDPLFPLTVGDVTGSVGEGDRSPRDSLMPRQALHAALLGFTHPMTNEPMTFQAPLADDLRDLVTLLRTYRFIDAPNVAGSMLDLDQVIP